MLRSLNRRSLYSINQVERVTKRNVSQETKFRALPRLMDFPEVIWPSTLKTIKNWFIVNFIIKPYLDKDFVTKNFVYGAKQALQVISSSLSMGDFSKVKDLVAPAAFDELKPNLSKLSMEERKNLQIRKDDIYLSFPYEIGLIFNDGDKKDASRVVEVTMVFHALQGLRELKESGEQIPWTLGSLPEYQERIYICNYRFAKEFSKGVESDWTVNVVSHFRPIDLIKGN